MWNLDGMIMQNNCHSVGGCVIIPDYVQPLFCVYTAINLIMPSFFQTYPGISPVYACNK